MSGLELLGLLVAVVVFAAFIKYGIGKIAKRRGTVEKVIAEIAEKRAALKAEAEAVKAEVEAKAKALEAEVAKVRGLLD
jgi:hypothetical protein